MTGSEDFDPTGMLLISDGELWLCCCKELDEALGGQLFYMRSQLFSSIQPSGCSVWQLWANSWRNSP